MPYKPIPPNSETYSQAIEAFISLGETRSPSLDFPPLPEAERQRLKLEKLEISSCCINSSCHNKKQVLKDASDGKYSIIYITDGYYKW